MSIDVEFAANINLSLRKEKNEIKNMSNLRKSLILGFDFAVFISLLAILFCIGFGMTNILIAAAFSIITGVVCGFCIFSLTWQLLDDTEAQEENDEQNN